MRSIVSVLCLLSLSIASADAETPCVLPSEYFRQVAVEAISGQRIQVEGDLLYSAGENGFEIWDVSRPGAPERLAHRPELIAGGVFVAWPFAYLAGEEFVILRISLPGTPFVMSRTPMTSGSEVIVEGNRAYVTGSGALRVWDVSDPRAPSLLDTIELTGQFGSQKGLALNGDILYEANRGLAVIDVSTDSPVVLDILGMPSGDALDVDLFGSTLVVVTNDQGFPPQAPSTLRFYDVSQPASPVFLTSFTLDEDDDAYGVDVRGDLAFVAMRYGIEIVDVANPTAPQRALSYRNLLWGRDIVATEETVFIAGRYDVLTVFDVTNLELPPALGHVDLAATALDSRGSLVTAIAQHDLHLIDYSDPLSPVFSSDVSFDHDAYDVVVDGSFAYVAGYDDVGKTAMSVVDITDTSAPAVIGTFRETFAGVGRAIAVTGDRVYIGTHDDSGGAVVIVDVSDPTSPERISTTYVPRRINAIAANDKRVIAAGNSRLWFWEPVSTVLHLVSDLEGIGGGELVIIDDKLVTMGSGIIILDLQSPHVIGQLEDVAAGSGVAVDWPFAYSGRADGANIFDIRDVTRPKFLGRMETPVEHFGGTYDLTIVPGAVVNAVRSFIVTYPLHCRRTVVAPRDDAPLLSPASPNPAIGRTALTVDLPRSATIRIDVFDVSGRLVQTLREGWSPAGTQRFAWDGRASTGRLVANGVYFIRLRTPQLTETQRVIFSR